MIIILLFGVIYEYPKAPAHTVLHTHTHTHNVYIILAWIKCFVWVSDIYIYIYIYIFIYSFIYLFFEIAWE